MTLIKYYLGQPEGRTTSVHIWWTLLQIPDLAHMIWRHTHFRINTWCGILKNHSYFTLCVLSLRNATFLSPFYAVCLWMKGLSVFTHPYWNCMILSHLTVWMAETLLANCINPVCPIITLFPLGACGSWWLKWLKTVSSKQIIIYLFIHPKGTLQPEQRNKAKKALNTFPIT